MTSNQVKPKICYAYMYIDACHYEPPLIYDWLQSLKRLKSILTSLENFSWWAETQLHELLIRVPKVVMFQAKYCVVLKLHRVPFKSLLKVQIKWLNVKIPFAYLQESKKKFQTLKKLNIIYLTLVWDEICQDPFKKCLCLLSQDLLRPTE